MKVIMTEKELKRLKDLTKATENMYQQMDNKETAIMVSGKLLEIIKLMIKNAEVKK